MIRWTALLSLLIAISVRAGVVQTLDGRRIEGEVRLESGQLAVTASGKAPVIVLLDQLLLAQFKTPQPNSAVPAEIGAAQWQARDIGAPRVQGSVSLAKDVMTVRGGGTDMGRSKDQFYYVSRGLPGDGQLIARVSKVLQTSPFAVAGLMVRGSTDPGAPYAMIFAYPDGKVAAGTRPKQANVARFTEAQFKGPWLKVIRRGNAVSSYCSGDGQSWELVSTENLATGGTVQVGFALCARNPAAACNAIFDHIAFLNGTAPEAHVAGGGRGVLLREGSMLSGQVRSASSSTVRLARAGEAELPIPLTNVARIVLSPAPRDLAARIKPGQVGVLLSNGDFFEGDLDSYEDGQVRINSVLFGPRKFPASQVLLLNLHDAAPVATQYEVRLTDGATLLSDRVAAEKDRLVVGTPAGEVRIAAPELAEIRPGTARYRLLTDLRPVRIEGKRGSDGWMIDSAPPGIAMALGGQTLNRGICMAAGASANYALGGESRMLSFRFGVPDGVLPVAGQRLVVVGDGREIYRSKERTSLDEPISETVNVAGVKELTIRLESTGVGAVGSFGLLAEPALIR